VGVVAMESVMESVDVVVCLGFACAFRFFGKGEGDLDLLGLLAFEAFFRWSFASSSLNSCVSLKESPICNSFPAIVNFFNARLTLAGDAVLSLDLMALRETPRLDPFVCNPATRPRTF
jgi:hypothetical protein